MIKSELIFTGVMLILVSVIVYFMLFFVSTKDEYCQKVFSSEVKRSWHSLMQSGDILFIEEGYINCCRYFYRNHLRYYECKPVPYGGSK